MTDNSDGAPSVNKGVHAPQVLDPSTAIELEKEVEAAKARGWLKEDLARFFVVRASTPRSIAPHSRAASCKPLINAPFWLASALPACRSRLMRRTPQTLPRTLNGWSSRRAEPMTMRLSKSPTMDQDAGRPRRDCLALTRSTRQSCSPSNRTSNDRISISARR